MERTDFVHPYTTSTTTVVVGFLRRVGTLCTVSRAGAALVSRGGPPFVCCPDEILVVSVRFCDHNARTLVVKAEWMGVRKGIKVYSKFVAPFTTVVADMDTSLGTEREIALNMIASEFFLSLWSVVRSSRRRARRRVRSWARA